MIIALTRMKWTDGETMFLENAVAVVEDDGDVASFEKGSIELSCRSNWMNESKNFHEEICRSTLLKTGLNQ